jgi:hypothetical protein
VPQLGTRVADRSHEPLDGLVGVGVGVGLVGVGVGLVGVGVGLLEDDGAGVGVEEPVGVGLAEPLGVGDGFVGGWESICCGKT